MESIEIVLSIASQIYTLVNNVKANKKRCRRVYERVKALETLVKSIKQRDAVKTSPEVEEGLKGLSNTLESAQKLIEIYTSENWVKRFLKSNSHGDEFDSVNHRLDDTFQILSGALQLEQGNALSKVFQQASREAEDKEARKEDEADLKRLLLEYMEAIQRETEDVKTNVHKIVDILSTQRSTYVDIRKIKPDELKYVPEFPKKPFMTTPTSEVYKGEYRGFPVAIKKYTDPLNTKPRQVESIFNKEVDAMKRFESPNILRMYGICIEDENTPNPEFFIIQEYCEKGSLRIVLSSSCKLPWTRKARMCLDAAQGLYRLHQTEVKGKVHGNVNSSKFLVTEDYRVKLGGFELTKTETSLRKTTIKDKEISSLCYSSPQLLDSINYAYDKKCEMYSFGIVLWEIATRKKPFEGCTDNEIHQKVCEEKFLEPLPSDCPAPLAQLINACRAYNSSQRPPSGVLVDELLKLVVQLEEL
ncbi:mixed lineage kinase domain-like protein [Odontesthes bonariensis]|uniref:mixed lineage kinase domain-like protein n=1 Tax=Odontesthes bonariensis TaxID=219752 RepID=UPI003F58B56C